MKSPLRKMPGRTRTEAPGTAQFLRFLPISPKQRKRLFRKILKLPRTSAAARQRTHRLLPVPPLPERLRAERPSLMKGSPARESQRRQSLLPVSQPHRVPGLLTGIMARRAWMRVLPAQAVMGIISPRKSQRPIMLRRTYLSAAPRSRAASPSFTLTGKAGRSSASRTPRSTPLSSPATTAGPLCFMPGKSRSPPSSPRPAALLAVPSGSSMSRHRTSPMS